MIDLLNLYLDDRLDSSDPDYTPTMRPSETVEPTAETDSDDIILDANSHCVIPGDEVIFQDGTKAELKIADDGRKFFVVTFDPNYSTFDPNYSTLEYEISIGSASRFVLWKSVDEE